jgi:class 3 adenylate cyclase
MHRRGDRQVPIDLGRRIAKQISNSTLIEYDGIDHLFWVGDVEPMLGDIKEFITGDRGTTSSDYERILTTVLFTDVVDSTGSALAAGDQTWHRLLDSHDQIARQIVDKHRGNLIKMTGDGILATFDGPGRAIRCALPSALPPNRLACRLEPVFTRERSNCEIAI